MASPQTTLARQCIRQNARVHADTSPANLLHRKKKDASSSFAWMKHGMGRLTAAMDAQQTRLTQVSHKAPMRWIPMQSSKVEQAGAAVVAMSNYGGGLLPGDVNQVQVQVQAKARLGIFTQGSNRIYKQKGSSRFQNKKKKKKNNNKPAKSTLKATVEKEGFLVVAPDPTVPFAHSNFHQQQEFVVHPTSSLIAIDWFSSGRFANGERWQAERISSETKLSLMLDGQNENEHETVPLVWDATTLDQRNIRSTIGQHDDSNPFGFDLGQNSFNAFASMLLYGTESLPVVQQLLDLQYQMAAPHTRLRQHHSRSNREDDRRVDDLGATGRVLLGVNELQVADPRTAGDETADCGIGPVYLARWAAASNEDLYRMFRHSLLPLIPHFGLEFYQDRIRATSSGSPGYSINARRSNQNGVEEATTTTTTTISMSSSQTQTQQSTGTNTRTPGPTTPTASVSWNAYMLADSALPTGSFAHSAGLEAASQLGLLQDGSHTANDDETSDDPDNRGPSNQPNEQNVQLFIQASTRSTLQQATPWILSGHAIGTNLFEGDSSDSIVELCLEEWEELGRRVHATMVCSAPACRASFDQGRNLLRVVIPWLREGYKDESDGSRESGLSLLQVIQDRITTRRSAASCHMAPLFGLIASALRLSPEDACQALGYCVARDIVSAAVRLNLIGPLKSVAMLSETQKSAQEGVQMGLSHQSEGMLANDGIISDQTKNLLWSNAMAGGCAPVVDAIHPCHDLLAVRLFRT